MLTGFLLAIAAGFGWGSMGVAAQVMMTDGGFTAQDLVALRVFGAGVLLTLMTLLTERGRVSKLFSDMVLLRDVVIYGLGVLATQFTFFLAIRDAGAATAAIMVITGPLFVIGWIAATTRKPVSILELAAFCLAATGVVLIITKGDLSVVNFAHSAVLWGLPPPPAAPSARCSRAMPSRNSASTPSRASACSFAEGLRRALRLDSCPRKSTPSGLRREPSRATSTSSSWAPRSPSSAI